MEFQVATELKLLGLAVIIGLVQLMWAAAAAQPQRGVAWNIGPRDEPRPLTGVAGRLERAFANYRETFPLFAAAVLAVYLAGRAGSPLSLYGAWIYVVARAAYVPLYAFGVPAVRSVAWGAALAGLIMVLIALFNA